jgi:uncharacterized lipoprotein NlpE involved in copper resistance
MLKFSGGLWEGALLLFCMVSWAGQASGQVKGTATYRERMALPPDTVFEATLEDVSKANAPAEVIGQARIDRPGNPPFRFEITYNPARIIASDQHMLVLFGGQEAPLKFAIKDANTLRQLDLEGHEIASSLNYDLSRAQDQQPLEPRLLMRGMYKYFADAGRFTECLTRQSWPVAQEQDNAALESAYAKLRHQPGETMLVTLEGRVAMRPKMEGEGQQPMLVVERFTGIWPGETCGARFAAEPLENTYWKLTRLGDGPVTVAAQQPEPHVILNPESRRVGGSGGCNRLVGSYERHGDRLTFGQRDLILFYEYFHGDNGAGLGASHQTGWTGLIARLLDLFGRIEAKDLELDRDQILARLVREQVGGEKTGGN